MRQFYNEDGSIAYREYIDEDEHVLCLMMHVYTVNKHSSHTLYANCDWIQMISLLLIEQLMWDKPY